MRRALTPAGYFSHFSVVEWPAGRTGLLHADDGATDVLDFDGTLRTRGRLVLTRLRPARRLRR